MFTNKRKQRARVAAFAALMALASSLMAQAAPSPAAPATITVVPQLDSSFLVNPDKGFVQYCMSPGRPYDFDHATISSFCTIGYSRLEWSEVEPQEGVFHWNKIDDFLAAFAKQGKKIAFGVMNVSTGDGFQYVTPKWVFDDGAQPLAIPDASTPTGTQIIPKRWDDPVFLRKMHDFVSALGRRYDGNPHLQFIDIRSYGNWGEGHTGMLGHDPNIILTPPENLQANYFEPYFQAFPHTQLIIPWGSDKYDAVYDWAVSQGAGIRRDGILSQWSKDGSECARAYGHAPAVFEYCYSYAETKKDGYWSPENLQKYVNGGMPSFLQWDDQIFRENTDFMLMLGNKIGYHFVLEKAVLPAHLRASVPFRLRFQWLNDGVAPLYAPCHVALALLDQNDQIVQKQWLPGSDPHRWLPSHPLTEDLTTSFSSVPSGRYKLAVGLFTDKAAPDPAYRLGIVGRSETNWYILSADEPMARK